MMLPWCPDNRRSYQSQAIYLIRRFVPEFDPYNNVQHSSKLDVITTYLYYQKEMKAEAITPDFITNQILADIAKKPHIQVIDKNKPKWQKH